MLCNKKFLVKIPYLTLFHEIFIHPRSELWNRRRSSTDCLYVGASEVGAILGVDPYKTFNQYWKSKLHNISTNDIVIESEEIEPDHENYEIPISETKKVMFRGKPKKKQNFTEVKVLNGRIYKGNMVFGKPNPYLNLASSLGVYNEPKAIKVFENLTNLRAITGLGMLRHREVPYLGGTPDAFIPERNIGLEIKCPSMLNPNSKFPTLPIHIKDYVFLQVLTLMNIFNVSTWYLFYYDAHNLNYTLFSVEDKLKIFDTYVIGKLERFFSFLLDACELMAMTGRYAIEECITPKLFDKNEKTFLKNILNNGKETSCKVILCGNIQKEDQDEGKIETKTVDSDYVDISRDFYKNNNSVSIKNSIILSSTEEELNNK